LGIETTSLVDTFTKLGEKGLSLDKILDLGVASTKSASGIAALTGASEARSDATRQDRDKRPAMQPTMPPLRSVAAFSAEARISQQLF